MVFEKLKRHKSPGIDQIPAEFIKQRVEIFAHIHKIINSVFNKDNLPEE